MHRIDELSPELPGRRRLAKETKDWRRMSLTIERFLGFDPGSLAEERG
jgi:hypothetical protein